MARAVATGGLFRTSSCEGYHQHYLDEVPNGYCPLHATGVKLPLDFKVTPLHYVDAPGKG